MVSSLLALLWWYDLGMALDVVRTQSGMGSVGGSSNGCHVDFIVGHSVVQVS